MSHGPLQPLSLIHIYPPRTNVTLARDESPGPQNVLACWVSRRRGPVRGAATVMVGDRRLSRFGHLRSSLPVRSAAVPARWGRCRRSRRSGELNGVPHGNGEHESHRAASNGGGPPPRGASAMPSSRLHQTGTNSAHPCIIDASALRACPDHLRRPGLGGGEGDVRTNGAGVCAICTGLAEPMRVTFNRRPWRGRWPPGRLSLIHI